MDGLAGRTFLEIERAMAEGAFVLSPLVVAELLSGDNSPSQLHEIGTLLQDYPLHDTPLEHWMNVGALRRLLHTKGINVTIPDAHVAQCALDLGATLYSRDDIFAAIAKHTPLRLAQLR